MKRGRPLKYDPEAQDAIIHEYEGCRKGERKDLAERLGIPLITLTQYIHNWKKLRRLAMQQLEEDEWAAMNDVPWYLPGEEPK